MTCWACLGQTTNSKVAFVIRGAACYGPRARRAKRSGRSSAKAPGSSYPGHRQKPSSWMPCVKPRPRTWSKKDSVLLRIANGSACRAAPSDRPKRNSINCVRGGRHYSLQAQGDFRGTATFAIVLISSVVSQVLLCTLLRVEGDAIEQGYFQARMLCSHPPAF